MTPSRTKRTPQAGPSIQISDQLLAKVLPMTAEHVAHFSSLESGFFKEGDDLSKGQPGQNASEDASEDALEESSNEPTRICRPTRWHAGRWPMVGAAVAIACVTSLLLLGRWHRQAAPQRLESDMPAAAESVAKPPTEFAAHAPVAEPLVPSPSQAATGVVAATKGEDDAFARCRKAIDQHRAKDVLANCPQAIDATPQSAELAVMLARVEFERGRARQALDWAKKAVALDAARAEAYVYLGGAEQAAGRSAAARAAYKRYLQLAPQGRHAADLRAVLANL